MAIIEKTAPNGTVIEFDTDKFSEEEIDNYLKLPEYAVQETTENKRNVVQDIAFGAVDGVRDGVQATIGLVDDLGSTLGEKLNIGKFQFGSEANNGLIGYKKFDELTPQELEERKRDFIELPDFEDKDPDTIAGSLTKGVAQFLTGWFTGGRILKGAKVVSKLGTTGQTIARGAVADFQAFDENTGRLVDIINDKAPFLQNPLFDYLSSDPTDGVLEARFKNALEGAGVGGAIDGIFRTFIWYKHKKAEANGEPFNKKQLAEDEKYLSNIKEEEIVLKKYKPLDDELTEEVVTNLNKELEDNIYNSFKHAQKNSKNRSAFDKAILDLDFSFNFNVRQLLNLNKNGLLTLDAFENAYEKLIKQKKIVLSDEQVERTAKKLYEGKAGKLEEDVFELQKVLKQAPHKIVALNSYNTFLASTIKRMAILAKREPKARKLLTEVFLPRYKTLRETKLSIASDVARTQRLSATSKNIDVTKEVDEILDEQLLYGGDTDEFIRRMSLAGNADVSKVLDYVVKNRTWDVANEVWINALLSNPKTHIINTTSNLVNMMVRPLEKAIGSRMSLSLIDNAQKVKALRAEGAKALSTYAGMRRYLLDGLRYAKLAFNKEDTILTSRSKLDTPKKSIQKTKMVQGQKVIDNTSALGKTINIAGKIIRYPSRFLNAEDEFFKQVIYRTELEKSIIDKAVKLNKSKTKIVATDVRTKKPITEFEQFVADEFEKGFDEFGRATKADILRKAEEGTYTNEVTGIFKRIADTTNEYPILKQILPFTRTPVNLMLNVVDRTPLGFIRKNYRDDFFGRNGAERMAQARGQLATGTMLMLTASNLHKEGVITGVQGNITGEKLTNSRDLKDLRKQTGAQPYSFRYYDDEAGKYKYIQFGRFDPFGAFFGIVADFNDFYDKLTQNEAERLGSNILILLAQQGGDVSDYISPTSKARNAVSAGFSAVGRNLFSKTYLKGLADFLEVLTDDDPAKLERYAKSKVGSFIPNIWTKLVNDPFYRDTKDILDEVKKRSGFGEEVEVRYDFRGNPLEIKGSEAERLFNGLINPFQTTEQVDDPVAEEILSLGINMPKLKQNLKGDIDLTFFKDEKGQTAYNRQMELLRKVRIKGKSLNDALLEEIKSSNYKNLSDPTIIVDLVRDDGGKVKRLKSIIKDYHSIAEDFLIKEAGQFNSIEDSTGKFKLTNAIKAVNTNIEQLKMGIRINPSALEGIYKFSQ